MDTPANTDKSNIAVGRSRFSAVASGLPTATRTNAVSRGKYRAHRDAAQGCDLHCL